MKVFFLITVYLVASLCSLSKASKNVTIYYNNLSVAPTKMAAPFDTIITIEMLKGLNQLQNVKNMFTLHKVDNELLAIANGFLDVFLWENNAWENLYKGRFGGNNFGSYKFIYEGEIYAFGGYGYWEFNNLLIKFNRAIGGWEFVSKLNSKDDLISPFCNVEGNKLTVTGGLIEDDNDLVPNQYEFTINLDDRQCTKTLAQYANSKETLNVNYQTNYTVNELLLNYYEERNNHYSVIYNKKNKQYYKSELKAPFIYNTPLILNDEKSIYVYDTDSSAKKISANDLLKGALPIGIPTNILQTNGSKIPYTLVFILVLVIGLVWYLFFKKKNTPKEPEIVDENNSITERVMVKKEEIDELDGILKHIGALTTVEDTVITPNRLDQLLEIDQLDIDSQRARRSQLIKSINEHTIEHIGYEFIHRIRDEKDRRYVNYQIGKPTKQVLKENH